MRACVGIIHVGLIDTLDTSDLARSIEATLRRLMHVTRVLTCRLDSRSAPLSVPFSPDELIFRLRKWAPCPICNGVNSFVALTVDNCLFARGFAAFPFVRRASLSGARARAIFPFHVHCALDGDR